MEKNEEDESIHLYKSEKNIKTKNYKLLKNTNEKQKEKVRYLIFDNYLKNNKMSTSTSSSSVILINPNYKFPEYYRWPFFFTLQRHPETRKKQIEMWIKLIIQFCKDNKVWRLSKSEFYENIGKNPNIRRKLNNEAVDLIFNSLVSEKKAMYVNPKILDDIFILWKSYEEWEKILTDAAMTRQSIEKIETLDFITEDEENAAEEYYHMDRDLLIRILKDMENKGKCGLLKDENGSYIAVKFLR